MVKSLNLTVSILDIDIIYLYFNYYYILILQFFLVKSNPKLDKAYEYLDNDKDEKGPENLKEYWDSFKSFVSKYLIGEEQLLK